MYLLDQEDDIAAQVKSNFKVNSLSLLTTFKQTSINLKKRGCMNKKRQFIES